MGFFFLISGYFVEKSYDRKGPMKFMTSKLLRLGVPLIIIVVFIYGLIFFAETETSRSYIAFIWFDYIGSEMEFGPLWFVAHLLIYSSLYVLWSAGRRVGGSIKPSGPVPGHFAILLFTAALIFTIYLVRQVWPQDVWVRVFGLVPFEPMHLPQYASLYVLGLVAGRRDWFERLPGQNGAYLAGHRLSDMGIGGVSCGFWRYRFRVSGCPHGLGIR